MSRGVRVAIAGTGFIGAVHARSARLAGASLVGVAASSPESARRAQAALGAERAYNNAEEMIAADDIDVVHICTPNNLHVPLAEAALAAGKHVILEKPIALDALTAQSVTDAAAGAGRIAAVPFVYRYYPTVREARERVATGSSGSVRLLHGTYLQDWLLRPEDDNWRVEADLGGASRAFADIGSHWCDLAEFVSGQRLTRLCARTLTAVPERQRGESRAAFAQGTGSGETRSVGTEDAAVIQFETGGGAIGTAVISQISAGRKNRLWLELDCADESLGFSQEQPETLWGGGGQHTTLVRRDPAFLSAPAARLATLPAGHPQGYADCFDAFVADVSAAVRDAGAPAGPPRSGDGGRARHRTERLSASAGGQRGGDVPAGEPLEALR